MVLGHPGIRKGGVEIFFLDEMHDMFVFSKFLHLMAARKIHIRCSDVYLFREILSEQLTFEKLFL